MDLYTIDPNPREIPPRARFTARHEIRSELTPEDLRARLAMLEDQARQAGFPLLRCKLTPVVTEDEGEFVILSLTGSRMETPEETAERVGRLTVANRRMVEDHKAAQEARRRRLALERLGRDLTTEQLEALPQIQPPAPASPEN